MAELRFEIPEAFENFVRVDVQMFQELLHVLGVRITTKKTWSRQTIDPGLRLAITLRYLATGTVFRVPHNTIIGIIRDVCKAIVATYAGDVINTPTKPEQWKVIAEKFQAEWQFPDTLGALDGKHVHIANHCSGHFKLLVLILTTSY